jgi:hypothetical protein
MSADDRWDLTWHLKGQMQHLEGSGIPVLYIGRKVLKG